MELLSNLEFKLLQDMTGQVSFRRSSLSLSVPHCLLSHCENSMVSVATVQQLSGLYTKLCDIGA